MEGGKRNGSLVRKAKFSRAKEAAGKRWKKLMGGRCLMGKAGRELRENVNKGGGDEIDLN